MLAQRHPWFGQMHEMMSDRYTASPASLITTPAIDASSSEDEVIEAMDICGAEDHSQHGRGLPNLGDMLDSVPASTSAYATPPSSQQRVIGSPGPASSAASSASTPATPTSSSKRKRTNFEQKKDTIADAYYRAQTETMQMRLQVEQERRQAEVERTKQEQIRADTKRLELEAEKEKAEAMKRQADAFLSMNAQQSQQTQLLAQFLANLSAGQQRNNNNN